MYDSSLFSTPSLAFNICRLFDDGHSEQCEMVLICTSLIINDVEHFSYAFGHLWSSMSSLVFSVAQMVKNLPAMQGDLGSIPGQGRSPGERHGNPL